MTHPLTDKDIQSIWDKVGNDIVNAKDEDLGGGFVEDDLMRTAYDLAIEHVKNVIELKLEALDGEWRLDQYETSVAIEDFCKELIQTMRPQEDN